MKRLYIANFNFLNISETYLVTKDFPFVSFLKQGLIIRQPIAISISQKLMAVKPK